MWWAVPPDDQTVFHTWQEKTTVYHEGVPPGHHLQLGSAIVDPDLNAWRKLASFTSGHGEGWALYAERLMDELGWLEDPGDRMGMLDSQRLRAARVVVDIGVHCRLPAPESLGGGIWDAEKAWEFLTASVAMDHSVLHFELDRYLGWPGQAPSYALGATGLGTDAACRPERPPGVDSQGLPHACTGLGRGVAGCAGRGDDRSRRLTSTTRGCGRGSPCVAPGRRPPRSRLPPRRIA